METLQKKKNIADGGGKEGKQETVAGLLAVAMLPTLPLQQWCQQRHYSETLRGVKAVKLSFSALKNAIIIHFTMKAV